MSQLPWMWLVSRASGLMLLVLFSTVFVLGISTRLGARLRSMPRFAVAELHRTLALFSVALLALHVATAVLDPYVSIGWWAAVLPFTAHYRPLALGLGTLAVDLGAAVLITSLIRSRLGYRWWRTVHWLAYASWPLAFMHSLSAGNDMSIWWVAALVWGSGSAVALAVVDRILFARQSGSGRTSARLRPLGPSLPPVMGCDHEPRLQITAINGVESAATRPIEAAAALSRGRRRRWLRTSSAMAPWCITRRRQPGEKRLWVKSNAPDFSVAVELRSRPAASFEPSWLTAAGRSSSPMGRKASRRA